MGIVRLVGRGAMRLSTEAWARDGRPAWTEARVGGDWPVVLLVRSGECATNDDARQIAPEQTPVCGEATQQPEHGRPS